MEKLFNVKATHKLKVSLNLIELNNIKKTITTSVYVYYHHCKLIY